MADQSIPPILLVRLKPRGPDGTVVGESRRVCHLVPLLESGVVPDVLRTYCGVEIHPGTAELLEAMAGMPCEPCLARSPIPAFAMLRILPAGTASDVEENEQDHDELAMWWALGLLPEQRITARFVLLVLAQDRARDLSVIEIALWLDHDPHTIKLIMLLYEGVGWIHPIADQARPPWAERRFQLTEQGASVTRRLLTEGMTPIFQLLADRLGLDTTVVSTLDTPDSGVCGTP